MTEEQWDSPDWQKFLPAWVREDRPMTEAEWLGSPHLYDRLRTLDQLGGNNRRLRLFACACCRRVWDLLQVGAARRIVELSEAYADGEATVAELQVANSSPEFADLDTLWQWQKMPEAGIEMSACVVDALEAARFLTSSRFDICHVVQNTSMDSTNDFRRSSQSYQIGRSPGFSWAEFAEKEKLLRDIFGNPFRPVAFDPAWRSDTAVSLAKHIYESRDFSAMPILADALQDAGCDNADILTHCRDEKQIHVRGCWVVDLVLGKE